MHSRSFIGVRRLVLISGIIALFFSCRKDHKSEPVVPPTTDSSITSLSAEDSLKYLMYHIMQVSYVNGGRSLTTNLPTYLWNTAVPSLNPLDNKYANADSLLNVMKGYAINPGTNAPYDRYSFLDRTGAVSKNLENGVSGTTNIAAINGTIGLNLKAASGKNNTLRIFVGYADKNSPAGVMGVTRGWEVISINGNTSFPYTDAFLKQIGDEVLNAETVTLGFKLPDGTSKTLTLHAAVYNINPVLFDSVLDIGTSKVGYFVFYTFSEVTNSSGQASYTKTAIDAAFSKFKSAGINNLIVDLRYNGGGSVATAEYLDSLIAPASAAGKVMYHYKYNDILQANAGAVGLAAAVNFPAITGGLALKNVFFITTRNTASASELTLNNLRPYMSVHLVGDTTYGKPVGFITFNISMYDSTHNKKYLADLYAINFATSNANNVGSYFGGIPPDVMAMDYIDTPWGDVSNDDNLVRIANFIKNGNFRGLENGRVKKNGLEGLTRVKNIGRPDANFNGMVDYKLSKKIQQLMK